MKKIDQCYITRFTANHIYLPPNKMTQYLKVGNGNLLDVIFENDKLIISKHSLEAKRTKWIEEYYDRATADSRFVFKIRGKLTMGFRWWCETNDIQTAYPVKGDKYDRKTGIAVCYAKCRNEKIPDYI